MSTKNKLISIHILEILNEHSSKKQTMSQADIMFYLENDYEEKISRHTCSDYLKELRDKGYITGYRGVYKNDLFSERELRTLIDAVMYGKHIPDKEANILIKKLKSLSQNTMKNKAKNINYFSGINRTDNNNLYEVLDIIDEAIDRNLKLKIYQYSLLPDRTKAKWNPKIVDPYFVVSDQSRYYLLCNVNRNDYYEIEPRRIDRFIKVEIVDRKRTPLNDVVGYDFDLGKYMREHIYMFAGEAEKIEFKLEPKNIGYLVDWCGPYYTIIKQDKEYIVVSVKTNVDAAYYWALQYGGFVEVVYPEKLRKRIVEGLNSMIKKYGS